MSKIRIVFASVNKWNKTIFTLKKIIISCVNYWTLHVKQPDIASGVWPETKPLLSHKVRCPLSSPVLLHKLTNIVGREQLINNKHVKKLE